jgi:hypothetical protein
MGLSRICRHKTELRASPWEYPLRGSPDPPWGPPSPLPPGVWSELLGGYGIPQGSHWRLEPGAWRTGIPLEPGGRGWYPGYPRRTGIPLEPGGSHLGDVARGDLPGNPSLNIRPFNKGTADKPIGSFVIGSRCFRFYELRELCTSARGRGSRKQRPRRF